jgi:catechol 2,3-dioxygenase-like lactoylglutathione lyase family enzyme
MTITAHIVVRDAERAVAFYRDAFGTVEIDRILPVALSLVRSPTRNRLGFSGPVSDLGDRGQPPRVDDRDGEQQQRPIRVASRCGRSAARGVCLQQPRRSALHNPPVPAELALVLDPAAGDLYGGIFCVTPDRSEARPAPVEQWLLPHDAV